MVRFVVVFSREILRPKYVRGDAYLFRTTTGVRVSASVRGFSSIVPETVFFEKCRHRRLRIVSIALLNLPDAHDFVHFHRRPFHRFVTVTRYLNKQNETKRYIRRKLRINFPSETPNGSQPYRPNSTSPKRTASITDVKRFRK